MSFDTLAPYYRAMEALAAGGLLQRCRASFLAEASHCQRALLLGEGPGRFLVELLRANPRVAVTCVERSPRMIQEARKNIARHGLNSERIRFELGDALAWRSPTGVFDLVATHFFLDCFRRDELEGLIANISAATTDGARWLLSDFHQPGQGWRKWRAQSALQLMYGFFRIMTGLSASQLTPPDLFLEAGGFRLEHRRLANFGLLHSDLWLRACNAPRQLVST
jgi:SAM-dependent methyltransferase